MRRPRPDRFGKPVRSGGNAEVHDLEKHIVENARAEKGAIVNLVTRMLGEICDKVEGIIQTGPFGSQLHQSDYRDKGTPVIMPKDLVGGKVSVESVARIGDEDVARLSRHQLKAGDIVYARRGDIGRRALITSREAGWMCGTGCMRISLGDSVVHSVFLHYYLGQPDVVTWIYNQAVGATMPNLNTSIVRSIPITYPPLPTQRKIAAILSAYDDLIENNTRRIAILEEMARAIYREWFVHFRFPGHEQAAMVDSELGPIPVGWEVVLLTELADFVRGVEPGSKNYLESPTEDSIPFLRVGDFGSRQSSIFIPRALAKGRILDRQDIAITLDGTIGIVKTGLSGGYSSGIRKAVIRDGDRLNSSLLYYLLQSDHIQATIRAHAKGTTILHAGSAVKHMNLALPPGPIMQAFDHFVSPLMASKLNLQERNVLLRQTRDLLLPRLISGEVVVRPDRFSKPVRSR